MLPCRPGRRRHSRSSIHNIDRACWLQNGDLNEVESRAPCKNRQRNVIAYCPFIPHVKLPHGRTHQMAIDGDETRADEADVPSHYRIPIICDESISKGRSIST